MGSQTLAEIVSCLTLGHANQDQFEYGLTPVRMAVIIEVTMSADEGVERRESFGDV